MSGLPNDPHGDDDVMEEKAREPWLAILLILLLVVVPLMYLLVHYTGFVSFIQGNGERSQRAAATPEEVLIGQGNEKKAEGDLDGAIADYDAAVAANPRYAPAYFNRGVAKQTKEDTDGALADFNKAIELEPNTPLMYMGRAMALKTKGDTDGAIVDYSKAISLKPDYFEAYALRGLLKSAKGDADGALSDINKAIDGDPQNSEPYAWRAAVKKGKGDMEGALSDFNEAIRLSKNRSFEAFHDRGCLYYEMRRYPEALADLRKAALMAPRNESLADYARFRICLVRGLMHEEEAGEKEMAFYMASRKPSQTPDDWPIAVGNFLAGQLPEADFLAKATDAKEARAKEKQCEAWFYAGTKRLIGGDKAVAREDFQKCLATGEDQFYEYMSAKAELKSMGEEKPQ